MSQTPRSRAATTDLLKLSPAAITDPTRHLICSNHGPTEGIVPCLLPPQPGTSHVMAGTAAAGDTVWEESVGSVHFYGTTCNDIGCRHRSDVTLPVMVERASSLVWDLT